MILNEIDRCPACNVKPIIDFAGNRECSNCSREFDADGVQVPNHLYKDVCKLCGSEQMTTKCNNGDCS